MAIQADHFHEGAGTADAAGSAARRHAMEIAMRHSRRVRVLRTVLPICAAAIGCLYFLSSGHEVTIGDVSASVSRVEISKDKLRMVDPKLEGVTDDNGLYKVTADYAEQEVGNTSLVHLHAVRAQVDNGPRGWTRLTAPKGLFNTKSQALVLTGEIKVTTDSGLTSYLSRANVDLKKQIITSKQPVKVLFPDGHLDSRALHIAMKRRQITFLGDVRLRTKPRPKEAKPGETEETGGTLAKAFDSDEPIDILAPRLTIYDNQKFAHFTGGVLTSQGGSRMTSRELKAHYANSDDATAGQAPATPGASGKLNRIEAAGDVRITTADGRTASGATLVYDAATRQLVIDQGVTLTQGESVLTGSRMVVDLATSVTQFPAGERVRGHFVPKSSDAPEPVARAAERPQAVEVAGGRLDLSSSRGKPVDVEADTLTVHDAEKQAVFAGNVLTGQGGMKMQSSSLRVAYGGDGKAGEKQGAAGSISTVRAEGPVLITTDKNQRVTSDWALFDSASRTVTIVGNVVLTQQENVIKGERLVIDLNTGRSRFEDKGNVATNGRVRMLFTPKDAKRGKARAAGE